MQTLYAVHASYLAETITTRLTRYLSLSNMKVTSTQLPTCSTAFLQMFLCFLSILEWFAHLVQCQDLQLEQPCPQAASALVYM